MNVWVLLFCIRKLPLICMTDNPEMEEYLKLLGKLNLRMGEMADLVTEVVYGIPVERKDIKK